MCSVLQELMILNSKPIKCKKKIDLIHINDKLNDTDSKNLRLVVRGIIG